MPNAVFIGPFGFINNGSQIIFPSGLSGVMDSLTLNVASQDIKLYRSAAKTLTIDTDGVGGSLTAILLAGSLNPNAAASYNLGSGALRWAGINAGSMSLTSNLTAGTTIAAGGLTAAGSIGTPTVVGYGDVVAVVNAGTALIATYTVGASDGTFEVSGNCLVTASATHSFSLDCTYTDEGNTARTLVIPVAQLAGSFVASGLITNVTSTGPYESAVMTIRAKATTAITIRTSAGGTFTSVTYNARGSIKQLAS